MPSTPTNPPPEGDSRANTVDAGLTCPTPPVVTNPSRDDRLKRWTHLSTLRKLLDKGASSFGPLKATVIDLAECIGKFDDKLNGKKEYEELKDELEEIFKMLNQHYNREAPPAVTSSVESLCNTPGCAWVFSSFRSQGGTWRVAHPAHTNFVCRVSLMPIAQVGHLPCK